MKFKEYKHCFKYSIGMSEIKKNVAVPSKAKSLFRYLNIELHIERPLRFGDFDNLFIGLSE